MKKTLLFLLGSVFSFYLFFSCEPQIANNERIIIEGNVQDSQGNAIPNLNVGTFYDNEILGKGITNTEGNFNYTSLKMNFGEYSVVVNSDDLPNSYSQIQYTYPTDVPYNLKEIELQKTVTLNFQIQKTSTEPRKLVFNLVYLTPICFYYSSNGTIASYCHPEEYLTENVLGGESSFETEIISVKNSEVSFTYKIDTNQEETVTIPLTEENTSYVFEY